MSPVALVAAPLALLLLLNRPGGRELLAAAACLSLVAWSVTGAGTGFPRFESAWVCLLSGGVVVALYLRPPERGDLVGTALVAVGTSALVAALLVGLTSFSWAELRWLAERHYGWQVRRVIDLFASSGAVGVEGLDVLDRLNESATLTVRVVSLLLPGLVLLQSVAALAAAWALYRITAREPEGGPLPSLREFRFNDHLIWGVVMALVVLVLPGLGQVRLLGGNLAAFFGGLYVARGLAVVTALAASSGMSGPLITLIAVLVTLVFAPLVAAAALALGVSDTWVDWRRLPKVAK